MPPETDPSTHEDDTSYLWMRRVRHDRNLRIPGIDDAIDTLEATGLTPEQKRVLHVIMQSCEALFGCLYELVLIAHPLSTLPPEQQAVMNMIHHLIKQAQEDHGKPAEEILKKIIFPTESIANKHGVSRESVQAYFSDTHALIIFMARYIAIKFVDLMKSDEAQ